MTKLLSAIAILVIHQYGLIGQNFQPVYSNTQSYFSSRCGSNSKCLFAVSVNSVSTIGFDSVFLNYPVIGTGQWYEQFCYQLDDTSWIGHSIHIKGNDIAVFVNRDGDSIKMKYTVGGSQSWRMFELEDSSYIEASIQSVSLEGIFGLTDSVKTILLQTKDSSGANIPHIFNGKLIKLSKHHGLLLAYDFSNFPSDTNSYSLIGLNNPSVGTRDIGLPEIFDFEIGDQFHYKFISTNVPFSGFRTLTKRIVTDRQLSSNSDTLIYTYLDSTIRLDVNFQAQSYDTTFIEATNKQLINLNGTELLDHLPFKPVLYSGGASLKGYSTTKLGTRITKTSYHPDVNLSPIDSCWYYHHYHPNYSVLNYIEGLGGPYFNNDQYTFPSQHSRTLVYYKKGNETWGKPLAIVHSKGALKQQISIQPNPVKDYLHVYLDTPIVTGIIEIVNSKGELLYHMQIANDSHIIVPIVGQYSSGMYMVRVIDIRNNESYSSKFIVSH